MLYARIMIPVAYPSGLLNPEDTTDYTHIPTTKLKDVGVQYVHEYYWPGDDYHAFIRFTADGGMLKKLKEIGEVSKVSQHYQHNDKMLNVLFEEKYNNQST